MLGSLLFIFFSFFLKAAFYLFVYWLSWVFTAVLRLFSSFGERGLLFVEVPGLLIVVAFLVAEHRLWGAQASAVAAPGI